MPIASGCFDERTLPDDLTDRLTQAVGMRNVLVHEYLDVDDELLLDALDRLSDFRAFAEAIRHGTPPSRDNN